MCIYFISDLHLGPHQPQVTDLCIKFLSQHAVDGDALYILGDFFEFWLGDDYIDNHYLPIIEQLKKLTNNGTQVYFMHGNRDFLVGKEFVELTGCQLIDDPIIISIAGTPTMLSHGDLFCSDDKSYQQFRKMVRDPAWQHSFLAKSIEERLAFASAARAKSKQAASEKSSAIMDVNQHTVETYMAKHQVTQLIHGHTHRPDTHIFEYQGDEYRRIVLSDWGDQGHFLVCDPNGCKSVYFD